MNHGYVRFWRKSLDAGWLKNHKLWAFWSYCLLKATYREYDAIVGLQIVHLFPGQFIFGLKKASVETGLTIQEIRTIIEFLKKAGNLTIKSTNKYSIISIINWDIYQGRDDDEQQANQQTTNKQLTTYKNIKNIKNNIYRSDSRTILSYLNEKTGKKYRNTKHIEARLKDGATTEDCKRVIDTKIIDPYFIANPKYLNPETLFRPSNFDRYSNEGGMPETSPKGDTTCPRCGKEIHVVNDLTETGCVYCQNQEAHP